MSFVGPRPLPLEYDTHYSAEQMIRFTVLPGLTGLVQISGRNALNWTERFELDIQYVKSLSLKNDIYIIRATFLQMFKKVPDENLFSTKWYGNR
jgi:sugar transferase EpsL